jgi:hypothetical protein
MHLLITCRWQLLITCLGASNHHFTNRFVFTHSPYTQQQHLCARHHIVFWIYPPLHPHLEHQTQREREAADTWPSLSQTLHAKMPIPPKKNVWAQ